MLSWQGPHSTGKTRKMAKEIPLRKTQGLWNFAKRQGHFFFLNGKFLCLNTYFPDSKDQYQSDNDIAVQHYLQQHKYTMILSKTIGIPNF